MSNAPADSTPRRVPLIVAATFFMLLLDSSILNTSLPPMAASLQTQPLSLSAAVTVYLLTGAAVLPASDWLGDRLGLRRLFLASVTVFTLASLACGLAQDPLQLVAARALQGIGGGLLLPIGRTLALRGAQKHEIIGITALLTWPALFAPVIGPPLGGWISATFSWRWNFLLNLPIGLVGLALVWRWVTPDPRERSARPLDATGALGGAAGLVLSLGGLEWTARALDEGSSMAAALFTLLLGGLLLAFTWRHLRHTAAPLISLAPMRHASFAIAGSSGLVAMLCLQAMPFVLPLLFQLTMGLGPAAAGGLLLPYFLGNLGAKSFVTPLLRRLGFKRLSVLSVGACAMAIATFSFVTPETPLFPLVVLLVVAGAVRSVLMTTVNTLSFAEVLPAERSAASTLSTVWMQLANALGVAVATLCLAAFKQFHGRTVPGVVDFSWTFLSIGLACAMTLPGFLRLAPETGHELTGRKPGASR